MANALKLKLNTGNAAPNSGAPPSATPSTPSIKFNLGPKTPAAPDSAKSTKPDSKKRPRIADDDGAENSPKPKKHAPLKLPSLATKKGGILKLSTAGQNSPKTPTTPGLARLKIKGKGKPPVRPLGVGYDSEAEDAEEDPAIEENVVLRMQPGPDCDYLRQAIENRTIGMAVTQGGADVYMRFYKHRRATIVIRGNFYAAVLVDLPCIVESMKSFDKRGWWKSADICQMLYVFAKVDSESEAEKRDLPGFIDTKNWLWPHGLTPPLHNVRKRRFRKRVSYRTIEAAEDEVQRLLSMDADARAAGGHSSANILDADRLEGFESDEGDEEDAMGEAEGNYDEEEDEEEDDDEEEEDQDALLGRFAQELAQEDPVEASQDYFPANTESQDPADTLPVSAAPTPAPADIADSAEKSAAESSDDDDDDAEDDELEEEDDEEANENAKMLAQQREEIAHLQSQIDQAKVDAARQPNPLIIQRIQKRIETLGKELANKKRSIGETDDDDDDA